MLGLPLLASAHGYEIDQMIYIIHGLMVVLDAEATSLVRL